MRFLRRAFFAVVALSIFIAPAAETRAKDAFPKGEIESLLLHDNRRDRDVPVKIYYPASRFGGARPVILFSHGAGGSKDGYSYLGNAWAEAGYVCIHVDHAGSNGALVHSGKPYVTLQNVAEAMKDPGNLVNRPLDVSFVIDMLGEIEKAVPLLRGRLDVRRIGVAGHSFGAYTVMALASAKIHLPAGTTRDFSDRRIAAFFAMSPQGVGRVGLEEESWSSIERPFLTMSGAFDRELGGGEASERLQAFEHMPPGRKFHVLVENADHMDFADVQFNGKPTPERFHDFVSAVGLAFWNVYLADAAANPAPTTDDFPARLEREKILAGDALERSGVRGTLQKK